MLQKLFGPAGVDYQDAKTSYDRVGAVEKSSITDVAYVLTTITSLADVDTALQTWLRTANERCTLLMSFNIVVILLLGLNETATYRDEKHCLSVCSGYFRSNTTRQ